MNQDLMELFQETTYLKKAKDGTYVINLDEYADVSTHWIALFCNRNETVFSIFLVLNMFLKRLKKQASNSVMCRYYCFGFTDFMLAGKNLTDFTDMFSPYDFDKNDGITLSYFKDEWMQFSWTW